MAETRSTVPWLRIVAEFTVIVVGVLVALAVDQWAERQAERRSETEYLTALVADLRADSTLFADVLIPIMDRAEAALDQIGPVVRGEAPIPPDTIAFLRQVLVSTGSFTQLGVRTTFDELLSTGSLRLIRSAALRASLAAFYEEKRLQENRSAMRASGYPDVVRTFLPGDAFGPSRSAPAVASESDIRAFGVERAVSVLRSDEVVAAMNGHINYLGVLGPALSRVNGRLMALISDLSSELRAGQ